MSEAHQKGSFALSAIGAQIGKHGRPKKKKKKKKNTALRIPCSPFTRVQPHQNIVVLLDILFESQTQGTPSLIRLKNHI